MVFNRNHVLAFLGAVFFALGCQSLAVPLESTTYLVLGEMRPKSTSAYRDMVAVDNYEVHDPYSLTPEQRAYYDSKRDHGSPREFTATQIESALLELNRYSLSGRQIIRECDAERIAPHIAQGFRMAASYAVISFELEPWMNAYPRRTQLPKSTNGLCWICQGRLHFMISHDTHGIRTDPLLEVALPIPGE